MQLKLGEMRKYRSIRGKLYLVENDNGKLKAYALSPVSVSKEMEHMFKAEPAEKKARELPGSWCGHEFTAEERCRLRVGENVSADDFVSKKTGKTFAADITWNGHSFDVKFQNGPKKQSGSEDKS